MIITLIKENAMNYDLFEEGKKILRAELKALRPTKFINNKGFIQHGTTTVYQHCVSVAYRSVLIAATFNIDVDMKSLIRGALLHDYFLYDWHGKKLKELHGFHHPRIAWVNATRDFELNEREQDIIRKHMFPMTIVPPKYRESWIICIADKVVSSQETLKMKPNHMRPKSGGSLLA